MASDPHEWVYGIPGVEREQLLSQKPLNIKAKAERLGISVENIAKTVAFHQRRRLSEFEGIYLVVVPGGCVVSRPKLFRFVQEWFDGDVDPAGLRPAQARYFPEGQVRGTIGPFPTYGDVMKLPVRAIIYDVGIDPEQQMEFSHPTQSDVSLRVSMGALTETLYGQFRREEFPGFAVVQADIGIQPTL